MPALQNCTSDSFEKPAIKDEYEKLKIEAVIQ